MKRLIVALLGIGLAAAACQQHSPLKPLLRTSAFLDAPQTTKIDLPLNEQFAPGDTLTEAMRDWLRRHDISPLWAGNRHPSNRVRVMEGFLGADHYRFSMVFTKIVRDATRPEVFYVRGKSRYRKTIKSFEGMLVVRQLLDMPNSSALLKGNNCQTDTSLTTNVNTGPEAGPFTARAQLRTHEAPAGKAGIFDAEVLIDFSVRQRRAFDFVGHDDELVDNIPTRGGCVLVRGQYTDGPTGKAQPFVVSPLVLAAAPDIYTDFGIGYRSVEVNPKYAKLGWNELWKNDEWWADSPKYSLNL